METAMMWITNPVRRAPSLKSCRLSIGPCWDHGLGPLLIVAQWVERVAGSSMTSPAAAKKSPNTLHASPVVGNRIRH